MLSTLLYMTNLCYLTQNAKSDAARNFDAQMEQLKSDYEYKLNAMRQRIKDLEADATVS
jgi:hypothetical protein